MTTCIDPHNARLPAWTDRPRIGAKLRELPCVPSARGSETGVTFAIDQIAAVFDLLKPYRRRKGTDSEHESRRLLVTEL